MAEKTPIPAYISLEAAPRSRALVLREAARNIPGVHVNVPATGGELFTPNLTAHGNTLDRNARVRLPSHFVGVQTIAATDAAWNAHQEAMAALLSEVGSVPLTDQTLLGRIKRLRLHEEAIDASDTPGLDRQRSGTK